MVSWALESLKTRLKGQLKQFRVAYVRRCYPFDRVQLLTMLRRLGVNQGDVLLVHSSFDQFLGFRGSAPEVVLVLFEAVGLEGTVLMPTTPFTGTAVEHARKGKIFDVLRTPSRMGLLSEVFRRTPGVRRSVHPTHSVAAWGAKADDLLADHHLAKTPCGRSTPYGRLIEYDGKILFLGTDLGSMTFFHAIEEELEPSMPFSPFMAEVFSLRSRDQNGRELVATTRLFDPAYSRRRNIHKLVPVLQQEGAWKVGRVGRLRATLLEARQVLAAAQALASRGVYCYESY
jgi:aminoglycoside 3-N-acetyltransferase